VIELDFEDEPIAIATNIKSDDESVSSDIIQFNKMIEGMPNSDYHSTGYLSSTKLPLIDLSVRAFENRHLFDFTKPVFDEGNLCHDCILLPHLVEDMYIESPTIGLQNKLNICAIVILIKW
jgi:hypothetical protein